MASPSQPGCSKRPSPVHVIVERTCRSITQIINKYKQKIYFETRQELAKSKCRDCGHLIGRCNFDLMNKGRRFNFMRCEEIGAGVFIVTMSILLGLGLFFIRRYNQTFIYGSGGCKATIFWTNNDCQILA
ncbi:uncharacterized protein LOC115770415 [Drosophila novamexicana]|uniref:uncharacterized protein LOC115770415 n=1 Tax=Drosophila novamexicana TaxID=47314 RepID=UPI0011E5E04F|nr:uncharacterized protein LOC115770415 [Drosophila novamexicana]